MAGVAPARKQIGDPADLTTGVLAPMVKATCPEIATRGHTTTGAEVSETTGHRFGVQVKPIVTMHHLSNHETRVPACQTAIGWLDRNHRLGEAVGEMTDQGRTTTDGGPEAVGEAIAVETRDPGKRIASSIVGMVDRIVTVEDRDPMPSMVVMSGMVETAVMDASEGVMSRRALIRSGAVVAGHERAEKEEHAIYAISGQEVPCERENTRMRPPLSCTASVYCPYRGHLLSSSIANRGENDQGDDERVNLSTVEYF